VVLARKACAADDEAKVSLVLGVYTRMLGSEPLPEEIT
jgi:hypothetical protein